MTRARVAIRWTTSAPRRLSIVLTLTVSLSARTPDLWPGMLSPTSPTLQGCLIEQPFPSECSIAGLTRSRRRTIKRRSCFRRLAPRLFQCCLQLIRGHCPSELCPDLTLRVDAPMQRDSVSQGKSSCMCLPRGLQILLITAD